MLYLIAIAAFAATIAGGMLALRFRDKLHLILGFSAGAVIGVAFFDLLPESLELGHDYGPEAVSMLVAAGFLLYLVLDRLVLFHAHHHGHMHEGHEEHVPVAQTLLSASENAGRQECLPHQQATPIRGLLGAASLCTHSFLDGMAIGLAFQVSAGAGYVVAFAVLAHDFSDGINTVSFLLKGGAERATAWRWLLLDAAAPVLGALSTLLFSVSDRALGALLALFTGFFIYIGASELIPESYHSHPKLLTTLMTVLGLAVIYMAIRLAGL